MSNSKWTPAGRTQNERRVRKLLFKVRNFMSGRCHRFLADAAIRIAVARRRKESAKYDPVWKESWWTLERRYTKLVKRLSKLELKYIMCKQRLEKFKEEK